MSSGELSVPGEPSGSLASCLSGEVFLDELSQLPGEVGAVFVLQGGGWKLYTVLCVWTFGDSRAIRVYIPQDCPEFPGPYL